MQVAILAGGLATRLGNLTKGQPKSMVRVLGKPFLEYQLELLRRAGIKNIVLCVGHMGEQIERHFGNGGKYGVNIEYSREDRLLGTAGALKKAEAWLNDVFFTMYGDSYLFLDFSFIMSYFKSHNKLALMTVYKNYDRYDRSNTVVEGNLVKKFSKRKKTKDMVYIEYGANIFRKEALNMIPENQFYSLDDLFSRLIEMDELLAFEVKERFYEIGSPQGLNEFEEFVRISYVQSPTSRITKTNI
ncbi:sugar phosphate nucleotidyltransferase [Dehalococcoidia bacterium]|nr:sugar phosphate nucleotidyltransferase [Dehalococcoidia bacterium]